MMMRKTCLDGERGFVLVTSLIMLSLLTLFSVAMYFAGRSAIQTSGSAQQSTEAYYYAETAIQYVAWALRNDAEFDSYEYTGTSLFPEPNYPVTPNSSWGDYSELTSYLWNPGPTGVAGASAVDTLSTTYTTGQVLYFDNSPLGNRYICLQDAATFSNCIDVTLAPSARFEPVMYHISTNLPRYIKLEISAAGVVTPSIPALPHANPPVVGVDVPDNGAVVWITAASNSNVNHDQEIFPLDPASAYSGTAPSACAGGTLPSCPCDVANTAGYATAQACDTNTGSWLSSFGIAAYAIGYVNGKPTHMVRAVIM
jgi:hypothetical protein